MEIRDIEYLLRSIDETLNRSDGNLKKLRAGEEPLFDNPEWLKNHTIPELCGELSGQLLFIKDRLNKELKVKKSKKFYQFWK